MRENLALIRQDVNINGLLLNSPCMAHPSSNKKTTHFMWSAHHFRGALLWWSMSNNKQGLL